MKRSISKHVADFINLNLQKNDKTAWRISQETKINRSTILALVNGKAKCGPRIDIIMPILTNLGSSLAELETYINERNK